MNKLLIKIVGLSLGLSMAIGVGVAASFSGKDTVRADAADDTTEYSLINNVSDLEAGKSYIITNGISDTVQAMAVTSNTNNRKQTSASVSNDKITRGASILSLTLGGSSGAWTFYTENYAGTAGYLSNAASGTSNNLLVGETAREFTITFDSNAAVITATSGSARNLMRYNSSSSCFACYGSGQNPVYLWKESGTATSFTVTYSANGATSGTVPEDKNTYSSGDYAIVLGNTGNLEKDGYTFMGWSYGDHIYNAGDEVEVKSNIPFVASWYKNDTITPKQASYEIYTSGTLVLPNCVTADGDGALSFDVPSVNYLTYDAETQTITADSTNTGGPATITAHKGNANCTFDVSVVTRPETGTFILFEDELVEGDYVVCSGSYAMKNVLTSKPRLEGESVVITDETIINPSSSVVWHIAKDGDYWTFYNEDVDKYVAFTSTNGAATLIESITDNAKFTVSGTYDFTNLGKTSNNLLRYNSGYGFAAYANSTGEELTLYKKTGGIVPAASVSVSAVGGSSLSLPKASSGSISDILSSVVYGSDGETLATNQKVTWSCEDATGVISFDDELKTYSVSGSVGATTKIYATSVDGSIKSSNYVSLTVAAPEMPYILIPGTNGYSDSAETTEIEWTNSTQYYDAYYLGIHFNMSGTGSTGQYNGNTHTWRMYQTGNTVFTVTVPLGKTITKLNFNFSVENTGQLLDSTSTAVTSETDWVPSSETQRASFTIGNSGSATNGQVQFKSIAVTFTEATNPTVVIDPITSEIIKGSTGAFTAKTAHATSPSIAWTSSASGVIRIDNASTGAYTAVGEGTATITATLTCSEGSATDTINLVVDTGLIEISEANNICEHLASGAQTDYKVTLSGHITDLDANAGKTNAFRIAKEKVGTASDNIMIFGIYSNNPLRTYAILNGTVEFTGYLKNYNGTYELVSPELVSYTDDAIEFATYAYNYLDESCQSGTQAVTSAQWTHLEGKWASDVDEYSQAKLISAKADPSAYGENIIKWVGRYEILVNAGFSDFMTNGSSARAFNGLISDETAITMIVVIAAISITSIGALLVLKKRKEQF